MAEVELRAERVTAGGDALAREPSGRVVFLTGALPGERVRARITEERRDYARAEVTTLLEAAEGRRSPPCPYVAAGCGGCSWQHVDPVLQRSLKREIVVEALTRTGGLTDPEVVDGPPLAPWGFRTTLRLAVRDGRPGFRARRSHDVVDVDACLVAHPLLADVVAEGRFPGASEVTLRCGVATGERTALIDPASAAPTAVLPADVALGPRAAVHDDVAGVRLRVSARSFFQTRVDGAEALVEAVRGAACEALRAGRVIDAYGGVGLFAAALAPPGEVVLVEQSRSSCADARHNLPSATVVQRRVEQWRPVRAGLVVADPSRAGLGRRAAEVLAATRADRIVLVSCDPVALARDARLLVDRGFRYVRSEVLDLFPHTPHVEVVTRFDRT
jgi:23S rRNA (uracil1939-C5)-methyltransferase